MRIKPDLRAEKVPIECICTDERLQLRTEPLDDEMIESLAIAYRTSAFVPPVECIADTASGKAVKFWLYDGHNRLIGMKKAGIKSVPILCSPGTFEDAFILALGANYKNSRRRTGDDKKKAVLAALRDPRVGCWSNRHVSELCVVAPSTVDVYYREVVEPIRVLHPDWSLNNPHIQPVWDEIIRKGGLPRLSVNNDGSVRVQNVLKAGPKSEGDGSVLPPEPASGKMTRAQILKFFFENYEDFREVLDEITDEDDLKVYWSEVGEKFGLTGKQAKEIFEEANGGNAHDDPGEERAPRPDKERTIETPPPPPLPSKLKDLPGLVQQLLQAYDLMGESVRLANKMRDAGAVGWEYLATMATSWRSMLMASSPWAICPYCKGHGEDDKHQACERCSAQGWLSNAMRTKIDPGVIPIPVSRYLDEDTGETWERRNRVAPRE